MVTVYAGIAAGCWITAGSVEAIAAGVTVAEAVEAAMRALDA